MGEEDIRLEEERDANGEFVFEADEVRKEDRDGEKDHRAGGESVSVMVEMPTLSAKLVPRVGGKDG